MIAPRENDLLIDSEIGPQALCLRAFFMRAVQVLLLSQAIAQHWCG